MAIKLTIAAVLLAGVAMALMVGMESRIGENFKRPTSTGNFEPSVLSRTKPECRTSKSAWIQNEVHPLSPALGLGESGIARIREIRDYTCMVRKRECVGGRMLEPEYMFAKVRHAQTKSGQTIVPFSVYLKFKSPSHLKNREVIYVSGENDNNLIVRKGGRRLSSLTVSLDPTSPMAMRDNRYPITDFGIRRLIERMLAMAEKELAYPDCHVEIDNDIRVGQLDCTRIEITHPVRRSHFEYHFARIYIDNRLRLPIRFEGYDWPDTKNGAPVLMEEYTYFDVKLNVGLTDDDFDRNNTQYKFINE